MTTIVDVEKLAFGLPETQRATLAAHLRESLPSGLQDDHGGIAEALASGSGSWLWDIIAGTRLLG